MRRELETNAWRVLEMAPTLPLDKKLLLDTSEAALLLNVCERTIRNLIRLRKLPCKFIGRRCLIPRAAIEKFAGQDCGIRESDERKIRIRSLKKMA